MATLGNTGTPGSGYWYDDFGNKQFWCGFTMPGGGGTATDFYVYMAGDGGSAPTRGVIWQGSSIAWQSSTITYGSGSRSVHGQAWNHVASGLSVSLSSGTVNLGFWSSASVVWTFEGSGGVTGKNGISSPSTASGGADEYGGAGYGGLGVYIVYTTAPSGVNAHLRRGGAWVNAAGSIRRAGAWSAMSTTAANVRRAGAWASTH